MRYLSSFLKIPICPDLWQALAPFVGILSIPIISANLLINDGIFFNLLYYFVSCTLFAVTCQQFLLVFQRKKIRDLFVK